VIVVLRVSTSGL